MAGEFNIKNGFISNSDSRIIGGLTASTVSATTYQNLPSATFSGGTVNGATNFTNGLTTTTISATTYQNLPIDIRVTGGTYTAGTATFTNNTGGTFSVTGFTGNYWSSGSTGTYSLKAINDSGLNATGDYAIAMNYNTLASGLYSYAEGENTIASGQTSHAEGISTKAFGYASHAEGTNTTASGSRAHAEGNNSIASGDQSHAEGNFTISSGSFGSHAEGNTTMAGGYASHAEGAYTTASANYSHSEGYQTIATGITSHAEGSGTTASGITSHAEGDLTQANGYASHAEGTTTIANGYASHAEGINTTASGDYSHAEGNTTIASGSSSHAEGVETQANGDNSHAQGFNTRANGSYSHAGGSDSIAQGNYSFVHGLNSNANGNHTVVFGNNITGTADNTVYTPYLNIQSVQTNNALTNFLVRETDGTIKIKSVNIGTTDVFVTGGTYSNGVTTFTNNTGGTFNVTTATNYSAGVISGATYSSAGSGQINLPAIKVALYNNANNIEPINVYDIASGTTGSGGIPALVDQDTNYIVVEYNGGSPRYYVYDNDGVINDSSVVLFMIVYRASNFVHTLEFGNQGAGLANKLNDRFIMTDRFGWESGLSLFLSASTGVVAATSGVAWNGPNRQTLTAVDSSGSTFFKNYHSGGTWTYTTTGKTINNTYYDNGTNIVSATAGKYLINWYFRGQEVNSHLYEVYGNSEFDNVSLAQLSTEPSLPELITSHAILLGRIIVQVGASTGVTESAFNTVFKSTQVTSHSDLTNLQGGTGGEYYHLTSNQYNNLVLTNTNNNFTALQTFNNGLSGTTISGDTLYGDGSNLTNITPYGLINAISSGNFLT